MTSLTLLIVVLGAIAVAALTARLFWPSPRREPRPETNWEQHNDTRMPSLENAPKAGDTAVDAAVAVQDIGLH
jgi:FtsZ-interacting cell division protein ZipA